MRKILFLLLTPFFVVSIAFLLMGGCCSRAPKYCGIYDSAYIFVWNNADSIPVLAGPDGVLAKALLLELNLKTTDSLCYSPPPFPLNTAYAVDCFPGMVLNRLNGFTIVSNIDFDANHPAGTDLKGLFTYKSQTDTTSNVAIYKKFYLMHAPSDTGTHTFTIKLFADDSTQNITTTAIPVKLLL